MIQQFIDRESELRFLKDKYSEADSQLIILYGKRRVGKTELIKNFIQKRGGTYILCTKDSLKENIKEMKRKFSKLTGKEYFLKLDTNSFFDLFKYLIEEIKDKREIIVLDEFPYLIEMQRGIVSVFQKIWDELLKNSKIFLILSGSSIGMMETEVLDYKSPLYGRRTGEWKLEPLKFKDIKGFFKRPDLEELVKIWCVCGGTPFYLDFLNPNLSLEQNIKEKVLKKGEVLYNEPRVLLKEEFREPKTYTLILKYLSLGYNSQGELSSVTGIEKGNLSKYLSVLEETRIVKYVLPFGKRKRGIYVINDPFFNFWFRFVYPNLSDLEMGLVNEVYSRISSQLNTHYGHLFENLILEQLKQKIIPVGFPFTEVRRWWYKDKEIDVVVVNEQTKKILFGECKWKTNVNPNKILRELKEKTSYVKWNNDERKEYYAIFAKSFSKKIKEKNVFLFDLKDMEKAFREKGGK